jgi:hypothetical protein
VEVVAEEVIEEGTDRLGVELVGEAQTGRRHRRAPRPEGQLRAQSTRSHDPVSSRDFA